MYWFALIGGKLFVGSQDCRINSFINITFYGSATDSSQTDPVTSSSITSTTATSKGMLFIHLKYIFALYY